MSNCSAATCQLFVGYISSANGGASWNSPAALTGAMELAWLPSSQNGLMVGDYIATTFTNGIPHGVFAVTQANSGTIFREAMYTGQGLIAAALGRQFSAARDRPLHNLSDKIERETPEKGQMPPIRRRSKRSRSRRSGTTCAPSSTRYPEPTRSCVGSRSERSCCIPIAASSR